MTGTPPLEGTFRVVDLSDGISGAYATKIVADAGAEVILLEPPAGKSLRQRSASAAPVDPEFGGVLFQSLSCSKLSVLIDPVSDEDLEVALRIIAGADAVLWSEEGVCAALPEFAPEALRQRFPHLTVVAITPFGLDNPWRGLPANEFTLQSMAGSAWNHGPADVAPTMLGGNQGDYAVGTAAALGLLVSRVRTLDSGVGETVDIAGLEVLQLTHNLFPVTFVDLAKRPCRPIRYDSLPGIHRTRDERWVGLWVTTGQQWLDFCSMIGREDWLEDATLGLMTNRAARYEELVGYIDEWTAARDCADIVELAALFRLPVAEVTTGETVLQQDHFVDRNFFVKNPRTGAAQPDVWYSMSHGAQRRELQPSPGLGADTERLRAAKLSPLIPVKDRPTGKNAMLPFSGLRIVDMTAFWADRLLRTPSRCSAPTSSMSSPHSARTVSGWP